MKSRSRLFDRRFLNQPGFGASAHALFTIEIQPATKNRRAYVCAYAKINDCYDSVSIDFCDSAATPAKSLELHANNMAKLRTLIDMLEQLAIALPAAHAEAAALNKPAKKSGKRR